jgi:hypothetical protein
MHSTFSTDQHSLSAGATSEVLSERLGGTSAFWATWLKNARKPGRASEMLKPLPGFGRPRYAPQAVEEFVQHRLALKAQSADVLAPKRASAGSVQFPAHISAVTTEEGAEASFVLLATLSPLKTYRLTSAEARNLARRLIAAADEVSENEEVTSSVGATE